MAKNCRIYVDADACPVKNEISEIASAYAVDVLFVASYAHAIKSQANFVDNPASASEDVRSTDDQPREYRWIYVDAEPEEVDLYIVNHAQAGDIAITQDHGLASLLSLHHVYVLSPRGRRYKEGEMEGYLFERYLSGKRRRAGVHVKGPRKMSNHDRECFSEQLQRILSINEGKTR